jgi:hypothetical protein
MYFWEKIDRTLEIRSTANRIRIHMAEARNAEKAFLHGDLLTPNCYTHPRNWAIEGRNYWRNKTWAHR